VAPTAAILQQMQQLRMKQRVFGSHRTLGDDLLKIGPAAEGFEAVFPYNPTSTDPRWLKFNSRYETTYQEKPDQFAALAYDAMQALLNAICRAGLNKGRIRDALTSITSYKGVTGDMIFDPNCKNIAPLFLARIHDGSIEYRRITMEKPYARVGEDGVRYNGPVLADHTESPKIAVFGPHADQVIQSSEIVSLLAQHQISIVSIPSQLSWGKASDELVKAVYDQKVVAVVALDRSSAHLAEQIAVKAFLPVIAISSDRSLTSTNIPWIFRLPDTTPVQEALRCLIEAVERGSPNRQKVRELLASGTELAGVRFENTGEPRF